MTALPEVLEKLERATPDWRAYPHGVIRSGQFHEYVNGSAQLQNAMFTGEFRDEDRDAAVAAVNWLREHGPGLLRDGGDGSAALGLLSRMRFACGDNGLRMQDELEEYLRGLAEDAARYRWLRKHAEVFMPGVKTATNTLYRGDYCATWDAAIDAAMHAPGGAG